MAPDSVSDLIVTICPKPALADRDNSLLLIEIRCRVLLHSQWLVVSTSLRAIKVRNVRLTITGLR